MKERERKRKKKRAIINVTHDRLIPDNEVSVKKDEKAEKIQKERRQKRRKKKEERKRKKICTESIRYQVPIE